MKISELRNSIEMGCDIEFEYENENYSITWGRLKGERVLSFCRFYNESFEFKKYEDMLAFVYKGKTIKEIIESIPEEKVWIS